VDRAARPDAPGPPPALARLLALAGAAACGDADLVAARRTPRCARGSRPPASRRPCSRSSPTPASLARWRRSPPRDRHSALRRATAEESAPQERAPAGAAAFAAVYGDTADRVRRGLSSLHPLLPAWTVEEAYGRVLSRPALGLREREVLAVSILTAMGGCEDALLGHMRPPCAGRLPRRRGRRGRRGAPSAGEGRHEAAVALLDRLAR